MLKVKKVEEDSDRITTRLFVPPSAKNPCQKTMTHVVLFFLSFFFFS